MQNKGKPTKQERNAIKSARRQSHSFKLSETAKAERSIKRSVKFGR